MLDPRTIVPIAIKDAIILYSLANEINVDYASIFWEDIIIKLNKKHREKVVPHTRFLSLLMMYKMKEGYGDGELTFYPTQVFSVNNWALKPNQPEEPSFSDHMLAIYDADTPVVFKAPNPSSKRGFPKAQSLELNLDTRSILLQNNPLCPTKRQQKTGPLNHPSVPKLATLRKEKSQARPWTKIQASLQFLHL
nr:hypothetical protein [Tanacetum cinerariifolium]